MLSAVVLLVGGCTASAPATPDAQPSVTPADGEPDSTGGDSDSTGGVSGSLGRDPGFSGGEPGALSEPDCVRGKPGADRAAVGVAVRRGRRLLQNAFPPLARA